MTTSDQTNAKQPQARCRPAGHNGSVRFSALKPTLVAFAERNEYVPDYDADYLFDKSTTLALLAGFAHNRRVMVQSYHGTGKSTHIEQVAARLNWPCVRVNLDSHVSRIDLVGKDAIVLRDGKQVTEFQEGILPGTAKSGSAGVRRI